MIDNLEEQNKILKECIENQKINQLSDIISGLNTSGIIKIKCYGVFVEYDIDNGKEIVHKNVMEIPNDVLNEWRITGTDSDNMYPWFVKIRNID